MSKVASIRSSTRVRSVFLSDIHLGFHSCSADYLCDFLGRVECQNLYLVGDIIDFWALGEAVFRALRLDGEACIEFAQFHSWRRSAERFLECQQRPAVTPAAFAGNGPGSGPLTPGPLQRRALR